MDNGCEIEGCENEALEGARFCPICAVDPAVPKGWGIFNTGGNGLGPGEYEIQKDDGSDVFGSDEEAARAHFELVEMRENPRAEGKMVVGRGPRTPEAVIEAERHDARLREGNVEEPRPAPARAPKVTAAEAVPGRFYRTASGRVLQIVGPGKVNEAHWPRPGRPGEVPYRIKANPSASDARRQVALYGWLPPDYPIRAAAKPAWWSRADKARLKNLK